MKHTGMKKEKLRMSEDENEQKRSKSVQEVAKGVHSGALNRLRGLNITTSAQLNTHLISNYVPEQQQQK